MENEEKKSSQLSLPAAVLTAGILVAGAVLFTHFDKKPSAPTNGGQVAGTATLDSFPKTMGVDKKKFEICMEEKTFAGRISSDEAEAEAGGIQGTPYAVVFDKNGNTVPIAGAASYENVKKIVDELSRATGKVASSQPTTIPAIRSTDHVLGDANAPIVIVEYSDIDCPFCKRFHPVLEQIVSESNGKVAWVYRHLPLDSLHPQARTKALAAECAASIASNPNKTFWDGIKTLMQG